MNESDISQVVGYEWKPAEKRKPRVFEVIRFRRIGPEGDGNEMLATFDGDRYYIFETNLCRWVTLEEHVFGPGIDPRVRVAAGLPGWLYAYENKKQAMEYAPYYAIAVSKISDIKA